MHTFWLVNTAGAAISTILSAIVLLLTRTKSRLNPLVNLATAEFGFSLTWWYESEFSPARDQAGCGVSYMVLIFFSTASACAAASVSNASWPSAPVAKKEALSAESSSSIPVKRSSSCPRQHRE